MKYFDQNELKVLLDDAVLNESDFEAIRLANTHARLFYDGTIPKQTLDIQFAPLDICIIDWLNFTFNKSTFHWCRADNHTLHCIDEHLAYMLGFGITEERRNGAYLYERAFTLGDSFGLLCYGGQRDSVLVSINSNGLTHARSMWRELTYAFLNESENGKITRIDLAHDDFTGVNFNIDSIVSAYSTGGFSNGNRPPTSSQAGAWRFPDGKGRTFYVGKRSNGLYFRGYEKGLQLQSLEFPNWFRCEVELKSTDRIIPFDVLHNPHLYFAGSYPIFNDLANVFKRVDTFQHSINADLNHREAWAKRQLGNLLHLLTERGDTPEQIISRLKNNELPPKFKAQFVAKNSTPSDIRAVSDGFLNRANPVNEGN